MKNYMDIMKNYMDIMKNYMDIMKNYMDIMKNYMDIMKNYMDIMKNYMDIMKNYMDIMKNYMDIMKNYMDIMKNYMDIMKNYMDIIVLTVTKLDDSFPTSQFTIEGYSKPFRHDRNSDGVGGGGGTLIYSREDIPCRELTCHTFSEGIEGIFIELNFRNINGYSWVHIAHLLKNMIIILKISVM